MNKLSTDGQLTIGQLAGRTGLNVSAIRYYEEVGLLPPALRRPSGHRVYATDAQELLVLIRHCRDFGFSIDNTKALVGLAANQHKDCVEARDIAQQHLTAVRERLAELRALELSLNIFVKECTAQCVGGPAPECCILKDLSSAGPRPAAKAKCCG